MQLRLSILLVWIIGLGDYWLTSNLIRQVGVQAELNLVARLVVSHGGLSSLLVYKLSLLGVSTSALVALWRRSRIAALRTARLAVAIYGLLGLWWVIALTLPS